MVKKDWKTTDWVRIRVQIAFFQFRWYLNREQPNHSTCPNDPARNPRTDFLEHIRSREMVRVFQYEENWMIKWLKWMKEDGSSKVSEGRRIGVDRVEWDCVSSWRSLRRKKCRSSQLHWTDRVSLLFNGSPSGSKRIEIQNRKKSTSHIYLVLSNILNFHELFYFFCFIGNRPNEWIGQMKSLQLKLTRLLRKKEDEIANEIPRLERRNQCGTRWAKSEGWRRPLLAETLRRTEKKMTSWTEYFSELLAPTLMRWIYGFFFRKTAGLHGHGVQEFECLCLCKVWFLDNKNFEAAHWE